MVWTTSLLINFVIIMLLTSVTGGLLVLIWLGIGRLLEKLGFINIVYELLKMVILFFFVPLSYLCLKLFESRIGRGFLFTPIPSVVNVMICLFIAWVVAVTLAIVSFCHEIYKLNRYFRDAIPVKVAVQKVLEDVCRTLEIPEGKIALKRSYRVSVPCVTGIFHAKIVLPMEEYDEETLRVILTHELIHFKQKDLLLKRISMLVVIFHFFNPLSLLLFEKIQEWSEYACDYRAYPRCGGMNKYFSVLVAVALKESELDNLSSQLYDDQHELVERVRRMKNVSKMKKRTKLSVVLVMCVAFFASSISVYATTTQTAKAYEELYRISELTSSITEGTKDNYEEYTQSGETPGITLIEEDTNYVTRATYGIDWEVPARSRVSGPYYNLTAGQTLMVAVSLIPYDVEVKVGIEDAYGYKRYVLGSDEIMHSFAIDTSGSYRVYIQNDSYTDATAEGAYIVTSN